MMIRMVNGGNIVVTLIIGAKLLAGNNQRVNESCIRVAFKPLACC
jgi:hypothetical protein